MATTSIGAPGVTFPDGTVQASSGATGNVVMNVYTGSSTWTKPATVKTIKVTVVGGGGAGGNTPPLSGSGGGGGGGGASIRTYPAPSIPGPQPLTVGGAGGTSSFGGSVTVISATGGATGGTGSTAPGAANGGSAGVGSNGNINITGTRGQKTYLISPSNTVGGDGGSSIFQGNGNGGIPAGVNPSLVPGTAGLSYGGGGGGGAKTGPTGGVVSGGAGFQGVVIVEEFY